MAKMELGERHRVHRDNLKRWTYLRDHYQGGLGYAHKGYLSRHERESDRNFRRRLAESRYINFCKPINNLFAAYLWRRKPLRSLPEALTPLAEDVDRFGTDVNAFMRSVTTAAGVEGHGFILVDAPAAPAAASKAHAEKMGMRPYFVHLLPQQVLDWEFELVDPTRFGQLNYAVLADPASEHGRIGWRVWRPDYWEIYRVDTDGRKSELVAEGENPLGTVPLICVYNLKTGLFVGESTIEDIAPLNHVLYQKTSILDEAEYWAGFPQLVIFTDEEVAEIELSQSRALQFRPGDEARFIEHSGTAVESLRTSINELKQNIFRIALKQIGDFKAGAGVESAAKRRLDRAELMASLEERVMNFEEAETKAWRLAARWMELDPEAIRIEYNRRFDLESINETISRLFIELGDKGYLPPDQVIRELARQGVISVDAAQDMENGQ